MQTLTIDKGSIDLCYIFEIGDQVRLNKASALIQGDTRRQLSSRKGSHERYFGYDPAPLIFQEITEPFHFKEFITDRSFEITLFDIGVVLARYRIVLNEEVTLNELVPLSIMLGEDQKLHQDARSRVEAMLERIKPAVSNPSLEEITHGYFLYSIESLKEMPEIDINSLMESQGGLICQILRQEQKRLSGDIISDALQHRISYTPNDITIIDWDSAIRFGEESRDIFGVIEFSLVQLLEMLYLDERIDDHNDAAYEVFSEHQNRGLLKGLLLKSRSALRGHFKTTEGELGQLAVDSTNLAINVSSAINLIGDPTLVRIYELASERFRLKDLEVAIDRKIRVLEGIYQKYTDRGNAWRGMMLEIVIILLIAIEVYQGLFNK